MKLHALIPALILSSGAFFLSPAPPLRAEVQVSFEYFHDTLSPYGEWVEIDGYGVAWHPLQVDNEWSPYQEGSWVYTDAGWTWTSEEPWADIVYHYGRWVHVEDYGWCWVPQYEWAPAWVSWRSSDDYVGWAPLPPEAKWEPSVGFSVWTDAHYDIGPRYYRFCNVRDFCEPNVRRVCRPWRENVNYMSVTVNITNINYDYDNRRVFVGGPRLDFLRDRTAQPVRHLRLVEDRDIRRSVIRDNSIIIARSVIADDPERGRDRLLQRAVRNVSRDRVDRGWRTAIADEAQRENLREQVRDQVRGLTPENRRAFALAKDQGGVNRREVLDLVQDQRNRDAGSRGEEQAGAQESTIREDLQGQELRTRDEIRRGQSLTAEERERRLRERDDNRPGAKDSRDLPGPDADRRRGEPGSGRDEVRRALPGQDTRDPANRDRDGKGDPRNDSKSKGRDANEPPSPSTDPNARDDGQARRTGDPRNDSKSKGRDANEPPSPSTEPNARDDGQARRPGDSRSKGKDEPESKKGDTDRPDVRKALPTPPGTSPSPRTEDRPPTENARDRDGGSSGTPKSRDGNKGDASSPKDSKGRLPTDTPSGSRGRDLPPSVRRLSPDEVKRTPMPSRERGPQGNPETRKAQTPRPDRPDTAPPPIKRSEGGGPPPSVKKAPTPKSDAPSPQQRKPEATRPAPSSAPTPKKAPPRREEKASNPDRTKNVAAPPKAAPRRVDTPRPHSSPPTASKPPAAPKRVQQALPQVRKQAPTVSRKPAPASVRKPTPTAAKNQAPAPRPQVQKRPLAPATKPAAAPRTAAKKSADKKERR